MKPRVVENLDRVAGWRQYKQPLPVSVAIHAVFNPHPRHRPMHPPVGVFREKIPESPQVVQKFPHVFHAQPGFDFHHHHHHMASVDDQHIDFPGIAAPPFLRPLADHLHRNAALAEHPLAGRGDLVLDKQPPLPAQVARQFRGLLEPPVGFPELPVGFLLRLHQFLEFPVGFLKFPDRGLGSGIPRTLKTWPSIELVDDHAGTQLPPAKAGGLGFRLRYAQSAKGIASKAGGLYHRPSALRAG
ncbi:MAG: hypothetical protein R6X17_15850 [Candidatus Competibacteraceae bacterium]